MRKFIAFVLVLVCTISVAKITNSASPVIRTHTTTVTHAFWVTYNLVPFPKSISQNLRFEFFTDYSSEMSIISHYNDGLRHNFRGYPYAWDVVASNFRWWRNSTQKIHELFGFVFDYSVFHSSHHRFWGGRNTTLITLPLAGNAYDASVTSTYWSSSTVPNVRTFTLRANVWDASIPVQAVVIDDSGLEFDFMTELKTVVPKNLVAARIGGRSISARKVEVMYRLLAYHGVETTEQVILSRLIETELDYQEALRQGLGVDREEATEKAAFARANVRYDQTTARIIDTIISALGMTEDEYWAFVVHEYQRLMSVTNLRRANLKTP